MQSYEYKLKEPIKISVNGEFEEAKSLILDSTLLTRHKLAGWLDGKVVTGLQKQVTSADNNQSDVRPKQATEVSKGFRVDHAELLSVGLMIFGANADNDDNFYDKLLSRLFNSGGVYFKEPHDLNNKKLELEISDVYFILGYYAINFTIRRLDLQG